RRETYEDARCRLERDPGRDGQLMSARADAGTALHGHIEYCACAGIGRDLTHHDLVAATHHYRPTAGQTIIEHCWMIDVEAAQSPVVQKIDLSERLHLCVGLVAIVVELLLAAAHDHRAAVPASRQIPVSTDVEVHPLVVGAIEK